MQKCQTILNPSLRFKLNIKTSIWYQKSWLKTNHKHKLSLQTAYVRSVLVGLFLASYFQVEAAEAQAQPVKVALNKAHMDVTRIEAKALEFLRTQTLDYPGEVRVSVVPLDRQLKLVNCQDMQAIMPNGTRPWGKTSVAIKCSSIDSGSKWTLYVQANVAIFADYVVAAEPLSQGQVINANQIVLQNGDITRLPNGVYTALNQVVGSTAKVSLIAGAVLRQETVKLPLLVRQGQTVTLISVGNGFQITAQGNAMNNAELNQVVQVKMASGKLVSGIVNAQGAVAVTVQ